MKPEQAARTLAIIGTLLLIVAALVRLLAAYLLTIDTRFLPGASAVNGERSPVMGLYTLSPDGRRVSFSRGVTVPTEDGQEGLWVGNAYSVDLDNGSLQPGAPEREMDLFDVRDNRLVILDAALENRLFGRTMAVFAVSTGGRSLAFAEPSGPSSRWSLYAVTGVREPELLAQESYFKDLAWSPDGQSLLYVAPVQGSDEVFLYDLAAGESRRLTSDGTGKREPVFSPDGRQVAYLAPLEKQETNTTGRVTPTPLTLPPQPRPGAASGGVEIFTVSTTGDAQPTRLTDSGLEAFDLAWSEGGQILFSTWREEWPMVAWLWGVDPAGGGVQRIYPATAIDRFTCAPNLWGADEATVRLTVSNTGGAAQDIPVEIGMDNAPLDVVTGRSEHRMNRESIRLNPGESRDLEYKVLVMDDQKIFLSATIESGVEFPLSAAFCTVEPRTLLLPRLRWFGATLALVLFGCLLSIPWLRHQKNPWLWRVWILFLVFFVILVAIESAVIFGAFG